MENLFASGDFFLRDSIGGCEVERFWPVDKLACFHDCLFGYELNILQILSLGHNNVCGNASDFSVVAC